MHDLLLGIFVTAETARSEHTCLMLLVHATVMQSSTEESTLYSCVKSIKATVQTFYALFVYLQL